MENHNEWMSCIGMSNWLVWTIGGLLITLFIGLWLSSRIGKGKGLFKKMALDAAQDDEKGFVAVPVAEYDSMVSKIGEAATALRPAGKVRLDGKLFDAVAEYGFIEQGATVFVSKCEAGQLYVNEINNQY